MKTLSEFKRYIASGGTYEVLEHDVWNECVGEIRKATRVQNNGFYAKAINRDINCRTNKANGGIGIMNWYGKASEYQFNGDILTRFNSSGGVWYRFRILDK